MLIVLLQRFDYAVKPPPPKRTQDDACLGSQVRADNSPWVVVYEAQSVYS